MIDEFITRIPIVTDMVNEKHVRIIVNCLDFVIQKGVPGSVVELGCNCGTTSVFIQTVLLNSSSHKVFHAYDSFEGLPASSPFDESDKRTAKTGDLKVPMDWFIKHFRDLSLPLPVIHEGWFKDQEYPELISFAFLDGDFYQSIMDSWEKVYPRLAKGAIVCVHDYGFPPLPGVKAACDAFLKDKLHLQFWDDYVAIFIF